MRITSAKLIALVVASGAATTLLLPSLTATAAPPPPVSSRAHAEQIAQSDDQPGPLEEKRRALRQQALTEVLNGTAKPQKRGASTVVKVSSAGAPAAVNRKGVATSAATTQDQYVELSREKTDKVFVVLTEFGNTRDPKYPDKDIDPPPRPGDVGRAAAQPDPEARPVAGQHDRLGAGLQPGLLPEPLLRHRW